MPVLTVRQLKIVFLIFGAMVETGRLPRSESGKAMCFKILSRSVKKEMP